MDANTWSRRCAAPVPITMATLSSAASAFCRPEEYPFLLLEFCGNAIESILRGLAGRPLRRTWIQHPYGEEDITLLEEEVLLAIQRCMARVEEIGQALELEQELEVQQCQLAAEREQRELGAEAGVAGMGYRGPAGGFSRVLANHQPGLEGTPSSRTGCGQPTRHQGLSCSASRTCSGCRGSGLRQAAPVLTGAAGQSSRSGVRALLVTGRGEESARHLHRCHWGLAAGRRETPSDPFPAMAIPQGPVCEVRPLVVHRYPPGVQKPGSTPCAVAFLGRRDKSVKTMRLIPAHKAFAFARKLQGTPGFTISGSNTCRN